MGDDKSKIGGQDRARVAGRQDHEVSYLTEKTGISAEEARALIRRYGNDRDAIEREAKKIRTGKN
jgi:hypothetical protein